MVTVLRWGVLSTARIGTAVIPATQAADRCEVTAIASRSPDRARAAADSLGIPRAHGSYQALLADPEVDAVYNPLPHHLHAEWTIAAARAGKHVLCEKPLALTVADAERMLAACEEAGVVLMEAFMYRLHPTWVAVRDLVQSGRIGTVRAVDAWFSYFNDDPADIRNTFEAGGGALWDIGCYAVNVARMLFGAEPARVEASIQRDPVNGCDVVSAGLLEFEGGTATFTCATRLEADERVHIYGSDGWISVPVPFGIPPGRPTEVRLGQGGGSPEGPDLTTLSFDPVDKYRLQAEAFARAVLEGAPVPIPPADAVANVAVIEKLFAAA